MTRYEIIKTALDALSISDLVYVHNNYCDADCRMDDRIYSMEEFDEIMSGQEPWEIARTCFYGDFCPAHDYFWFNAYGNACSSDYPKEQIIVEDIAEYIDRTGDSLGDSDMEAVLDEYDVEQE